MNSLRLVFGDGESVRLSQNMFHIGLLSWEVESLPPPHPDPLKEDDCKHP